MKTFPGTFARILLILALSGLTADPSPASGGSETWLPAADSRSWSFPADHGSHPRFQTEWWYFTGNLTDAGGRDLGYQLTFFRTGLATESAVPQNPWSVRDLYLAHLAVSDGGSGRFYWTERVSRTGPGLAGAREGRLEVWLRDWTAVQSVGGIVLEARADGVELHLTLTPRKPPVLHGLDGLSVKGSRRGQASYYASITDLLTEGTIRVPDGERSPVSGLSWFDHEFGSNHLAGDQEGWDWFGLHLSDGTEIMIYLIRRTDGSIEPASSGTYIYADGSSEHLSMNDVDVTATGTWKSPQSGARYPSGWDIRIPRADLGIHVSPLIQDQELATKAAAGITYWEGAVRLEGSSGGKAVNGAGYVELTGYAGGLGGIF